MSDWRSLLNADPTDWLLEKENPSVRYFTLLDILDCTQDDADMLATKRSIMESGMVPAILNKQSQPDYKNDYPKFYTNKYKGLVWSLIVLAELGAEASPEIKTQCEYLLSASRETSDGGFAMHTAAKTGGGRISEVIPCLTGNMVWSLIHFGYLSDPRLQRGIDWITTYMRFNDGVETDPQAAPYDRYEVCWGKHTCHMGIVKTLKALSAIPQNQRTNAVNDTIEKAVEFILIHHIYKRSHDLSRVSKPGWLKFSFPLMYQTDALEILDILTALGVRDSRMDDALKLVVSKQDESGRWAMENVQNTIRLLIPVEQKGEPSKWLTLRAMRVLKRYYGSTCF